MPWPQRKTRWIILGSLIGLLLVGGILLCLWRPGPSIRFVGFQEAKHGKVVTFRIANDTDDPYSFTGYAMNLPLYSYKIQEASGWKVQSDVWNCTRGDWFTMAPHAETEIMVPAPHDASSSPFKVGIYLERGTPAEISARGPGLSFMSVLILKLRMKIQPDFAYPEPIWSDTVHPQTHTSP
ncbi:hypothetical protein [Prosthecobacter sp.]|uniref:hypothetical protein n=1 Tax=Prosthecobacter sp. TaxID=1965333 RepID=UPI0037838E5D